MYSSLTNACLSRFMTNKLYHPITLTRSFTDPYDPTQQLRLPFLDTYFSFAALEDITLDCTDAPDPSVVDLFPGTPHTLQDDVTNEKVGHRQATKTDEDTLLGDHAHKSSSSHRNNVDALNNHSLTTQDAQPLPLLPDMSDHPESALDHTATSSHAAPPPPTIEDKGTSAAPKPIITDSATPRVSISANVDI